MQVGDLVTVGPANESTYLIIGKDTPHTEHGSMWILYSKEFPGVTMAEKWITKINA